MKNGYLETPESFLVGFFKAYPLELSTNILVSNAKLNLTALLHKLPKTGHSFI